LNLGDLLGLILFVVFFVLPAISRLQRRNPGAPAAPPGRTMGTPTGRGASEGADTAPPPAFPPLEDDDLARRLQEARERVRQAMAERQAGSAGAGTSTPSTPRPVPPPKAAPAPKAPTAYRPIASRSSPTVGGGGDPRTRAARPLVGANLDDGLLGTPLPVAAAAPAPRPRGIARDLRARAPQVEVQRLEERAGQPALGGVVLPLDARGIRDGFVWHQVLGAPRARRRLGGGPFPER